MPSAPSVLLSTASPASAGDLRGVLVDAGFAVVEHELGSSPTVEFDGIVAAVIDVGDDRKAARAQTRRWWLEQGDVRVPVLWVLRSASPEEAVVGLETGADVCLARPIEAGVLASQVRAMMRATSGTTRLAAKAAEVRLLGDQLRKAYDRLDLESAVADRVHRSCLPNVMPPVRGATFAVCHRPRGPIVRDFYHCRRIDEDQVAFLLGSVLGPSATISSLLAVFIHQVAGLDEPPGEVLAGVNRQLLALDFDEPPLIGMSAGRLDARDGSFSLARAGLPAPVWLPANGPPATCGILGPFLGTADTTFETSREVLQAGDRLVLAGDAVRIGENGDGLPALATRHRHLTGQAFVDALERDLLQKTGPQDPITLMVIEKGPSD